MNKSIAVLTCLLSISKPIMSFAATTLNPFDEEAATPITCPKEIHCLHDRSISSCKAVGDNLEYWGEITSGGWVVKGVHYFETAAAYYQSSQTYDDLPRCEYFQPQSDFIYRMALNFDPYCFL